MTRESAILKKGIADLSALFGGVYGKDSCNRNSEF